MFLKGSGDSHWPSFVNWNPARGACQEADVIRGAFFRSRDDQPGICLIFSPCFLAHPHVLDYECHSVLHWCLIDESSVDIWSAHGRSSAGHAFEKKVKRLKPLQSSIILATFPETTNFIYLNKGGGYTDMLDPFSNLFFLKDTLL